MLPYIKIYRDFIEIVRELDNGARGRLFMALMQYANGEEVSNLTGGEKIAYLTLKSQIDRDREAYDEVSEKRKAAGKVGAERRWEQSDMANAILPMANDSKNGKCYQDKEEEKDKDKEEEKDKDKDKEAIITCPEQQAASAPPVAFLPLNDGTSYGIMQDKIDHWYELYPAVNVEQELRNMQGWLEGHPKQRKTRRGITAFITTWLSREQDRGGTAKPHRTGMDYLRDMMEAEQ